MRNWLYKYIIIICFLCIPGLVNASSLYDVTVSRIESNFYEDTIQNLIIQTSLCFEIAILDDAVLQIDYPTGNPIGKLLFSGGSECDVVQIYEEVPVSAGQYALTVSRVENDFYEDSAQDVIIHTRYCYEYVYSQAAILTVDSPYGYNIGTILFDDILQNICDVQRVLFIKELTPQYPNLYPYTPSGWDAAIVVSNQTGTNTDSSPLYTTDTIFIDWAVGNASDISISSAYYTSLYVDDNLVTSWYANSTSAWGIVYVEDYNLGSLGAGQHKIEILTDSTFVLDETLLSYSKNLEPSLIFLVRLNFISESTIGS